MFPEHTGETNELEGILPDDIGPGVFPRFDLLNHSQPPSSSSGPSQPFGFHSSRGTYGEEADLVDRMRGMHVGLAPGYLRWASLENSEFEGTFGMSGFPSYLPGNIWASGWEEANQRRMSPDFASATLNFHGHMGREPGRGRDSASPSSSYGHFSTNYQSGYYDRDVIWMERRPVRREDSYIIPGSAVEYPRPIERPRFPVGRGLPPFQPTRNDIYWLAKDQQGCRMLQQSVGVGKPLEERMILQGILGHARELMVNPYANYLMQKIFEVCDPMHLGLIINEVTWNPMDLVKISMNAYGTRSVQKLIEVVRGVRHSRTILRPLKMGFHILAWDPNGTHVIQHCLKKLPYDYIKYFFTLAEDYCVEISIKQHGCCCIKGCVEHSKDKDRISLVNKIAENALFLAQDQFGNYVIQAVIDLHVPLFDAKLMEKFEGRIVELSKNKFSSNVVEKCLRNWPHYRRRIIDEMLELEDFFGFVHHEYGNFVFQAAVLCTEGCTLQRKLLDKISESRKILESSPYCKRIRSILNREK